MNEYKYDSYARTNLESYSHVAKNRMQENNDLHNEIKSSDVRCTIGVIVVQCQNGNL